MFGRLPIELVEQAVQELDKKSLTNLVQVNKEFRRIAEKHLYKKMGPKPSAATHLKILRLLRFIHE
ncbi:hypothetical protein PABG_11704 [Paracoccidioides brasiliensis Pb03]|nr:hypothetical protein PABG_11704 [Paracoccidioides brasiliensis Pb03]